MSRSEFTASANVRVVVEVQGMGPYGEGWTAEGIHDKVAEEAVNKVKHARSESAHHAPRRERMDGSRSLESRRSRLSWRGGPNEQMARAATD